MLDPQGVSHVQVLDQLLGSWLVNGRQALLPVLKGFLQRKQSLFSAMSLIHMLQCVLQGKSSKVQHSEFWRRAEYSNSRVCRSQKAILLQHWGACVSYMLKVTASRDQLNCYSLWEKSAACCQ